MARSVVRIHPELWRKSPRGSAIACPCSCVSEGPVDRQAGRYAPQPDISRLSGESVLVSLSAHLLGDEHLALGRGLAQPCRDVHVHADEVVTDPPGVAGVHTRPEQGRKPSDDRSRTSEIASKAASTASGQSVKIAIVPSPSRFTTWPRWVSTLAVARAAPFRSSSAAVSSPTSSAHCE